MTPTHDLSPSVVLRPTKCKICGHEFPGNSLNTAAIVGDNPKAKLQQIQALISPMMKHLTKKHPQQVQWAQMMGGEWGGLLMLNLIQCDEPTIERQRDETRWKIHQMTRRVQITDERIEERLRLAYLTAMAQEIGCDVSAITPGQADYLMKSPTAVWIMKTMRDMRDVLQEKDRYAKPKVPAMDGAAPAEEPPKEPSAS